MSQNRHADVVVVGGGLAGLAAAAYLGRAGRSVVLLEKARQIGGRAATHEDDGFHFNLGPHALYRQAEGYAVLAELGVSISGRNPNATGGLAIHGGRKHTLPGGFLSLVTTSLLRLSGKLDIGRLLSSLFDIDPQPIASIPAADWLAGNVRNPVARDLVQALFRLTSYANAPGLQSAGQAVEQLQRALKGNVLYLDGGWQTLVDGLRRCAENAGVKIVSGCRARAVEQGDAGVTAVLLARGDRIVTDTVVVTGSPAEVAEVAPEGVRAGLERVATTAIPVRAACLDLGLRRLPAPRATFALGVDTPLYLSVHSAAARLAPEGGATVHVAKYLPAGVDTDPRRDQAELEQLMELVQPGWRSVVASQRFLPTMTVSHAVVTAAQSGLAGRPSVEVGGVEGFYRAGDWIGSEGLLADASLASARAAAQRILSRPRALARSAA